MDLGQLIRRFRIDATDLVPNPYLFADEWVMDWLNDAQREAAVRGRLIYEASSPAVCEVAVSVGVATYPLHASLYEIVEQSIKFAGDTRRYPLKLVSREDLNRLRPDWRDDAPGTPRYLIQDDTRFTLSPAPDRAAAVLLEGYRLPKEITQEADKPEINAAHHVHLVHWALHRAFSRPDADTLDPQRAEKAEKEFTRYFGIRPDSDLRRATREDQDHSSKVYWG